MTKGQILEEKKKSNSSIILNLFLTQKSKPEETYMKIINGKEKR